MPLTDHLPNKFIPIVSLAVAISFAFACLSCSSGGSLPTSGGKPSNGQLYMLCYTAPTARVVHISAVFPIRTATPTIMLEQPWAKQFRVYVAQSNGQEEGASATCDRVTDKEAVKKKADELRRQGHQVVETGWTYAGG